MEIFGLTITIALLLIWWALMFKSGHTEQEVENAYRMGRLVGLAEANKQRPQEGGE